MAQCLVVTARGIDPDGDVGSGAVAVQQSDEGGVQHHEECGPLPLRQGDQPGVQGCVDADVHGRSVLTCGVRARPVGVHRELGRQVAQVLDPVVEMTVPRVRREQGPLPQRVVGVLDGQWPPCGSPALGAGGERGGEVGEERIDRPAVGGDVVEDEKEHVFRGARAQQQGTQRQFGGHVEGAVPLRPERLVQFVRVARPDLPEAFLGAGVHEDLVRLSVGCPVDGAQDLVPVHDVVQRRAQGLLIQFTGEPYRVGVVVGAGDAVELLQEAEALLLERQGNALRAGHRDERRAVGGHRPGDPGETGGGRLLEHVTHMQFDPEDRAGAVDQLGGEQGVTTEFEEAVPGLHQGQSEHFGEQLAEHLLVGGDRGPVPGPSPDPGRGQCPVVELAVHREGQVVDRYDRRHHVGRQPTLQTAAQIGRRHSGRAWPRRTRPAACHPVRPPGRSRHCGRRRGARRVRHGSRPARCGSRGS